MTKFKAVWFYDSQIELNSDFNYVMSFFDDSQPKPSLVKDIVTPPRISCHSFNSIDSNRRQVINLVSDDFSGAQPLWYVYVSEPINTMQIRMVFAYADGKFPEGTVIGFDEAVSLKISPLDAAGFVRWFVADSRIQQIFVHEEHRRKRISVKLFSVADLLIVADRNWNGNFLNGGDITTSDGELLRSAWSLSTRVTPREGSVSG